MIRKIFAWIRRNKLDIALIVIAVSFVSIAYLEAITLAELKTETQRSQQLIVSTKKITDQLSVNSKQRTAQIQTLTNHIDCIGFLFSQSQRATLKINNITDCTLLPTN